MSNGINFFGSWETSDGIGRAAALNLGCLEEAGIPTSTYVLSRPVALQSGRDTVIDGNLISTLKHRVNLFQFSARWVPHYFSRLEEGTLNNFYNIGYWFCEVPHIPDNWAHQMKYFDEIWTSSSFCANAFSRSAKIPVTQIPLHIEPMDITKRIATRVEGGNISCFNFLTVFNVYSDAERKNILFTIRAFLNAHAEKEKIRLIVKVSNLEHDPILADKLTAIRKQHKNIEIIDGYIETEKVQALYKDADAYVSLHRAEGFGLTISDAMSRGIPVITTGYSGNMEFCRADDTRLVAYKLRSVGHERLRYRADDVWAEPDMPDAVLAFQEMVIDHGKWLQKARLARARISKSFSTSAVASLMRERLELINRNFTFHNDMKERPLEREVGIYEEYGF
jgi:glycosyltransferase involved in cell wall biosynthesis